MHRYPVTEAGAKLLQEELLRLKTKERPAIIQAIAEARSHGDLSENADYDAAKERQGFIEGRIHELESKISRMEIIDPTVLNAMGKVVFGSTVILDNFINDTEITYKIVGEDEADVNAGKISVSSPIGRALLGKSIGDEISVETPKGIAKYEIVEVEYSK